MKSVFEKLNNIIRFARVTLTDSNDTRQFPQAQYEYMDKVKDIVAIYPYGMIAKAPIDNLALLFTVGHEENSVSLEISGQNREKGFKSGEAAFGNWVTESHIKFLENGDVEIIGKNDIKVTITKDMIINVTGKTTINSTGEVTVTAPTAIINAVTTINGNSTINGNLQVNGNVIATGSIQGGTVTDGSIDLATHTHGGVTSGGASTGPAQ